MQQAQEIDWSAQWECFAENFYDGFAHIDLTKYGNPSKPNLILSPGPGFGDLSHPTTQLMMEMMIGQIEDNHILDIGSGSGILSLAAKLLGAHQVCGIDIDQQAVLHALSNARLNDLEKFVRFSDSLTNSLPQDNVLLMNMILSEQREVMKQKELFQNTAHTWILSGILEEQLTLYLQVLKSWNLAPKDILLKDGWLGFLCHTI